MGIIWASNSVSECNKRQSGNILYQTFISMSFEKYDDQIQ